MMNRKMPWADIATLDSGYNVLLIAGSKPVPIYWGKNPSGQCLLIIELAGNHNAQFRKDKILVNGIGVDLRQKDGSDDQRLIVSLGKHVDQDLFLGLCDTLIASLDSVDEPSVAIAVTFGHLKRWRAFLAGKNLRLLSPEEVRGLFAELLFLYSLIDGRLDEVSAVEAWCGADRAQQDFIFGNTAVEIKSLTGKERNSIRISSEDQLEALTDNLFLNIYRLSIAPDSKASMSLNDIVRKVEVALTDSQSIERFAALLAAYGYAHMLEYEKPQFMVSSTRVYRVAEGFPRIVRSALPLGLARVSYDIELEAIDGFECENDEIFAEE